MLKHAHLFLAFLLVLVALGESPSAQTFYHPDVDRGITLGAGYGHLPGEDVNTFTVDAVGTVTERIDVAASAAWILPSFGRRDGWSGTLAGTGYVVADPNGYMGLTLGLNFSTGGSADDIGVVYGGGVAGRIDVTAVTLIPQLSIAAVTSVGGGEGTSGGVGVALGIGAVEGNPSLVFEPFASYGFDPSVISVGATLRVAVGN